MTKRRSLDRWTFSGRQLHGTGDLNTAGGGAVNLYTVLFILFFSVGYGAYYATADMPIPMLAWAATLIAMRSCSLTGAKMKAIQAVNAARKQAVAQGTSLEQAMKSITNDTVKIS